jgi:hypothetical protein
MPWRNFWRPLAQKVTGEYDCALDGKLCIINAAGGGGAGGQSHKVEKQSRQNRHANDFFAYRFSFFGKYSL